MKKEVFEFLAIACFLLAGTAGEGNYIAAALLLAMSYINVRLAAEAEKKNERRKKKW